MNAIEHKTEAERLQAAVQDQIARVREDASVGISPHSLSIQIIQVTVTLALSHATLATVEVS